jgi:hypothetical protein
MCQFWRRVLSVITYPVLSVLKLGGVLKHGEALTVMHFGLCWMAWVMAMGWCEVCSSPRGLSSASVTYQATVKVEQEGVMRLARMTAQRETCAVVRLCCRPFERTYPVLVGESLCV